MSLIITIGRQFGSGGRDVGEKVAEYFNIPFYDKELVELAAQKSNISKEALKEVDEHATNSFLYSLASGNYSMRGINAPIYYEMPINDKLFIAQADVIKEVAKRGSCVIVGRCADYVLKDCDYVKSLFFYAPRKDCIERVMQQNGGTKKDIEKKIDTIDKYRADYYKYYTGREWNDARNYDFCLDTTSLSYEKLVQVVKAYLEISEAEEP